MENIINSLVSQAVGVTDQQIKNFLATGPSDAQIAKAMETYGVSPTQMAQVTGLPEGQVAARVAATVPPGQAVLLGNTWVQPNYQISGSGENQQIGPIQSVQVYKTQGGINDQLPVGTAIQNYAPTGEFLGTGKTQKTESGFGEFLLGSAALFGGLGGGLESLLGGGAEAAAAADAAGGLLPAYGTDAAYAAGLGMTPAAEAALAAQIGGGTALGSLGALGTDVAGMGAGTGLAAGAAGLGLNAGTAGLGAAGTGAGLGVGTGAGLGAGLGSTLAGLGTGVGGSLLGSTLGSTLGGVAGSTLGSTLGSGAGSALGTSLATGLGLSALGSGLGAAANQAGISNARDLINQYGTQAQTTLADAYKNAQALNAANRTDLGNIYANTSKNMQNLYNQQVGYQEPYQDIGRAGSQGLLANQDYLTRQFTNADLNANLAPNYAFMLGQGQMANQRAANMGGGALGGNALQGLQRYTQDYAGNAYQNAFNNFNTQRQNIFGNLSNMAQIGTTSAGQLANLGANYGSNLGSLASNYGSNLTTSAGQGINAANQYGLNTAGLATGIGGALASNATQSGANTAGLLSNLGNTALLGSMIKAT